MDLAVSVLKWISQVLIVVSGVSALFHELSTRDASSGKKRLSASGRLHMTAILTGLVLFGATEIRDVYKAADERAAAEKREEEQRQQIENLKEVLKHQRQIEALQQQQVEDGRKVSAAQQTVIENQAEQNKRLRELLLSSYQLSGVEASIRPAVYPLKQIQSMLNRLEDEYRKGGLAMPQNKPDYLDACLAHGHIEARKGEREQWLVDCQLARPQGITSPRFYLTPESFQWRAFEGLLDLLFGKRFRVTLSDGSDLLDVSDTSRPAFISRAGGELKIVFVNTRVKLSQLMRTEVQFRMERARHEPDSLPKQVRLRSVDPLVRFDGKYQPSWTMRKIGTIKVAMEPGEEPEERDLRVPMAGPFPLVVKLDRRFEDAGTIGGTLPQN